MKAASEKTLPLLRLTQRGKIVVAALVGLAFSAFLFHDVIVFIAFAIFSISFLSELVWTGIVVVRPNRFFILHPRGREEMKTSLSRNDDQGRIISYAPLGEEIKSNYLFVMKARGERVSLSARRVPNLRIGPSEFGRGERSEDITFNFSSPFGGVYPVESLDASVIGPLGLFETNLGLRVGLEYHVYPKVYDVAVTASKILGKSGIGEIPTRFRGIGTEFYDSRQYQSGDDAKKINWKASARMGKLIVNDRVKEVGAAYFLILSEISTSYFDRDRLASTFLQISNTLATLGINFGFLVYDGNEISSFRDIDAPLVSLKSARSVALDLAEVSEINLERSLIAPIPSHRIQPVRDNLSKAGLASLSEFEGIAQRQMLAGLERSPVFKALFDIVRRNPSEPPDVVYIGDTGALSSSSSIIATVIEASAELRRAYGAEFVMVDPTMPWVLARDEREAVLLYEKRIRTLEFLRNANVEYRVGGPLKIAEELFS